MKNILIFAAGLGIGAVITNMVVKDKYRQIADEEIASVKETFEKRRYENESEPIVESEEKPEVTEMDFMQYAKILNEEKYVNYSDRNEEVIEETTEKVKDDVEKPYIIEPMEFGELPDYETLSLTYYEDGVLTDEFNEPIDDIDECVGRENLKHIGEFEDDSLHVRNDKRLSDYEILVDSRKYSDVVRDRYPHRVED